MDIIQLTTVEQHEIERLFAANLFLDPLSTLRDCFWLPGEIILTDGIKQLWVRAKERISLSNKPEEAQEQITQIALELGLAVEIMRDATMMYTGRPDAYAQELLNRSRNVHLGAKLPEIAKALSQNDHEKVDSLIKEIGNMTRVSTVSIKTTGDIHDAFVEFVNNRGKRTVETFVPGLDVGLGGLPLQNLTVIGARPSMGKTALAWQIARDVAMGGEHVAFFSLEMSEIDLWMRAACPEAGVPWRDVITNRLSEDARRSLIRESQAMRDMLEDRLMVDDRNQTTGTIWQYVSSRRPKLVVVDHLRLLQDKAEKGVSENKRQGLISYSLKSMAKSFNCAVLALAQLNRQVEGQDNKRPTLKDLRDSGEIEENADIVMFIHSPDYYDETKIKDTRRGVQVWVEKNRNGQRMIKVSLLYDMIKQRFYPAEEVRRNLNGSE